ncbi:MAG: nitroreductase family protein, partial [Actinomycetota bacterium]
MSALDAVRARHSWSKVTDDAPTREELLTLVAAAGRVADHSSLRPWRLIELRGDDRVVLGKAIAEAEGDKKPSSKPLRAPLLIAIVASFRTSSKVPRSRAAPNNGSEASNTRPMSSLVSSRRTPAPSRRPGVRRACARR